MKIQWLGHSCFAITLSDGRTIITDPHEGIGYPPLNRSADIVTVSHQHFDHNAVGAVSGSPEIVQSEGAHSLGGVAITGVPSFHDGQGGSQRGENLIFIIEVEGLRVCHLGDLGHVPGSMQIGAIGRVDVLMVPVGGLYTIDAAQAAEVVRQIGPKYILPMHYKTSCLNFPISGPDEFLAGYPDHRTLRVLEISAGSLPSGPQAVLLDLA